MRLLRPELCTGACQTRPEEPGESDSMNKCVSPQGWSPCGRWSGEGAGRSRGSCKPREGVNEQPQGIWSVASSGVENALSWVRKEIGDPQLCSDWSALLETVEV